MSEGALVGGGEALAGSVAHLLDRVGASEGASGAGFAAALTVALSAEVVASAARAARGTWVDAGSVAAQAEALRGRAAPLAAADAAAHDSALTALRVAADDQSSSNDEALGETLGRAAAVPLRIAEIAADVADLAALTAVDGPAARRADATGAAALTAAASAAAARLVAVNLTMARGDDRVKRAEDAAGVARAAAERALSTEL